MIIRTGVTDLNPVIGWDSVVTINNIAATTEDADFPATNLANPATHLKWKNGANSPPSDDYLTVSGFSAPVSYVGIAQHNFGSGGFTLTIQSQTATDSPSGWHDITAATAITDDTPLIFQFPEIAAATGIRVRIQGGGVNNAEAAVLFVGSIMTMERSLRVDMNNTPINLGTASDIMNGMSESGQFIGRIVRSQWKESKLDFWYFNNSFFRADVEDFIQNAVENTFFLAWAPQEYPSDTGYCWLTKDPIPEFHLPTERFIVSFEMRGLA